MKRILITGCLMTTICLNNSVAQDSLNNKYNKLKYMSIGVGFGFGSAGAGAAGTILMNNNFGFCAGLRLHVYPSKNKPSDYYPGGGLSGGNILGNNQEDQDRVELFSMFVVMRIPTRLKNLRLELGAGPSFNIYSIYTYTPIEPTSWFLSYSSNYEVHNESNNIVGLSLKTAADYIIFRKIGVEFGAFGNINQYYSFMGFELNVLLV